MKEIYYINPETDEIEASYVNCESNSTYWENQGFIKYTKKEAWMKVKPKTPKEPELTALEEILIEKGLVTEAEIKDKKLSKRGNALNEL